MLAKQTNFSLIYTQYKVFAINNTDSSYFVEYLKDIDAMKLEYCWCRANQALKLGSQVDGYLCPTEYHDQLPTLVVGECNSIIPTANRIAVMSR